MDRRLFFAAVSALAASAPKPGLGQGASSRRPRPVKPRGATFHVRPGRSLPPITSVNPGDQILLHGGTYRGALELPYVGTERDPVVVRNAPGENVKLTDPSMLSSSSKRLLLWIRGAHQVVEEHPSGGEFWLDWEPPTRTDKDAALGFRVSGNYCEVRNLRVRGVMVNTRDRVKGGRISGVICTHWGVDSPHRGAGHAIYAQNDGDSRLVIQDCLLGVGYGCCIHVFGSKRGARNILISRCAAIGSHALSQREAVKAPIVVDEEDRGQFCDAIEISECVVGNPYRYPEGSGLGHASLQLGGPRGTLNGSIVLRDCDFLGPPAIVEPWAWVRASGLWIAHRPGQTGVDQGWVGRSLALHGELEQPTIVEAPGYPERFPPTAVSPRVRVWPNPTEAGRTHVVVTAMQGETSVTVDAGFERGRRYRATEVMRDVPYDFTASGPTASVPLPDVEPRGCVLGRNPHPIAFQFLIRRV